MFLSRFMISATPMAAATIFPRRGNRFLASREKGNVVIDARLKAADYSSVTACVTASAAISFSTITAVMPSSLTSRFSSLL